MIAIVFLALSATLLAQEPAPVTPGSLTIEEVLRESGAGVSDELIIARVKKNAKAFDLNTAEILALKKSGVSETVIKYLVDPTLPYSPQPASAAVTESSSPAANKFPYDPLVENVPPETGVYFLLHSQDFQPLDRKSVVPEKQPGKFSKLIGGHVIGSIAERAAKVRVGKDPLVFYARLGSKITIDDLVLLSVKAQKKRRELDFGSKPGTPVFPPKSVQHFESKEVGPGGLYRITAPALGEGEYVFFILGSEEDKKGLLGRGYDFGVDKP